ARHQPPLRTRGENRQRRRVRTPADDQSQRRIVSPTGSRDEAACQHVVSTALVTREEIAMAVVKGVKEKVHLPVFDSVSVKPGKRLGDILTSNVMRFFQDVTGKTKLQTNMQAASLLPHWNTYEARALRVVISDLPAQFPDTPTVDLGFDLNNVTTPPRGTVTFNLRHFVDLKRRIEGPNGQALTFLGGDEETGNQRLRDLDLKITVTGRPTTPQTDEHQLVEGESFTIDRAVLKK